ncbi:MAG TPA: helix-turn-helix domain-containing protein [Solirubrobacteraceae bacterium]|jgi:DNA-binding HxlR family transcriptional regulator|nr:helix-turn-helix domain-containing protein [Solirubrobacteraceae bacterium]
MEHGLRTTLPVRAHRQWTPLARALTAVGDHWTLLIVLALSHDKLRLNALRTRLPGVSSGVLDHHLSQMIGAGLLSRERFREMPPRVEVVLTDRGRELLPIAASLARWGMRHEWPAPDNLEHVRADAILRQLPALLETAGRLPDGVIEAVVSDNDFGGGGRRGECVRHWFEISEGRLEALDEPAEEATAQVQGDEAAWIAALGPGGDCSGLRFAGKRTIVKRMLDSLPRDNCL